MAIRYGDYKFVFDYAKFRNDLIAFHDAHNFTWTEIDQMSGLTIGYVHNVASGKFSNHKIENILALCNVMDVNPQDYFVLDI